jgi:molybdopterin-guanine dinucleotide biosynthesis protein A
MVGIHRRDPAGHLNDLVADPVAAIVLAGGAGRRLGGADKAALDVGGRTLLERALDAVSGVPAVVVGPARPLAAGVFGVCENPAGGGPAAGLVAGLAALEARLGVPALGGVPRTGGPLSGEVPWRALILVLAVDHPGVSPATFSRLVAALRPAGLRGAVLVSAGRRHYGVGVYSADALRWSRSQRPSWHGAALRSLLGLIVDVEVAATESEAEDVDSPEDLARWRSRAWPAG